MESMILGNSFLFCNKSILILYNKIMKPEQTKIELIS